MTEKNLLARVEDCPLGKMFRVKKEGKQILLANVEGRLYAVDDLCTHEDVSLSLGCLQAGGIIKCSLHGSRFKLETGEPLDEPATETLRTYPLEIRDGMIYLSAEI